jgi:hypothetical protein
MQVRILFEKFQIVRGELSGRPLDADVSRELHVLNNLTDDVGVVEHDLRSKLVNISALLKRFSVTITLALISTTTDADLLTARRTLFIDTMTH